MNFNTKFIQQRSGEEKTIKVINVMEVYNALGVSCPMVANVMLASFPTIEARYFKEDVRDVWMLPANMIACLNGIGPTLARHLPAAKIEIAVNNIAKIIPVLEEIAKWEQANPAVEAAKKKARVVSVTVSSASGMGRSTVAEIIRQALAAHGIDCDLNDDNGTGVVDEEEGFIAATLDTRVESMIERGCSVAVRTAQLRRS